MMTIHSETNIGTKHGVHWNYIAVVLDFMACVYKYMTMTMGRMFGLAKRTQTYIIEYNMIENHYLGHIKWASGDSSSFTTKI
jgi:hypothetical protein